MLKPYEMCSVVLTGSKNVQEPVIKELHALKVLHIVEHSKTELADIGTPLESANRLSEALVRVRALISSLSIKKEDTKFEIKKGLPEIESAIKRLNEEANASLEELKKTEELMSKSRYVQQELKIMKDINVPLEYFASYKSLACFTGYIKNNDIIPKIESQLLLITKNFMLLKSDSGNKSFIALFVDAKASENAGFVLNRNGFSPVTFPNIANLKGTPLSNLKNAEGELAKLEKKKENAKTELKKLAENNKDFLVASEKFLVERLEKAEAPLKFASTPSSFLVKGWIPNEDLHKSIERLNKAGKGRIYIQFEPAKKNEKAPVKMNHPNLVKPFEFFISLYSMPTYREIDPTFFIFLTFPIFFGIMLGDIGYGLVSLAVFWILKKKMPKAKNFFNILMLASIVTILFGFLFGEFFGYEEIGEFHLWHILSRANNMFLLLFLVLVIGVIHVNIGLLVGFINTFKEHGFMAAVYEKASWIVLELGVAMLVLSLLHKILISWLVGAAFLVASVLMVFKGEGIRGLFELPTIFTNILSYARLMAIGLSSVELAIIINNSAKDLFNKGGFFILIGILILIIGHIINILLGLLGSFLHSMRLHYVEFFSKFFAGGGKKYQPFGLRDEE